MTFTLSCGINKLSWLVKLKEEKMKDEKKLSKEQLDQIDGGTNFVPGDVKPDFPEELETKDCVFPEILY